jgi:hypothetical protein
LSQQLPSNYLALFCQNFSLTLPQSSTNLQLETKKTGRSSALLEDFTMRRLLLQASLALLMTPVIACAPTPAIVSGSILISAVSALEANSSGPVSSTHVENRLQNANEGAKDTAVPVGVMPAVATGGGVEEPNKFTIFF